MPTSTERKMAKLRLNPVTPPRKLKLKPWIPGEASEQEHVFAWASLMEGRHPELALLSASMNGILTDARFGAMLKRLGRKKGYPDLFLPVMKGRPDWIAVGAPQPWYGGLYIELKRKQGGKLSVDQEWWLTALAKNGYKTVVALGADAAIAAIKEYLGITE
jgi:VRR-NUC domain-containing protein